MADNFCKYYTEVFPLLLFAKGKQVTKTLVLV